MLNGDANEGNVAEAWAAKTAQRLRLDRDPKPRNCRKK